MAAPNIVNVSAIYGKVVTADLTTTSATSVLSNASSSGKVFKVDSLVVANIDTANAVNVTVSHYSAAAIGGTGDLEPRPSRPAVGRSGIPQSRPYFRLAPGRVENGCASRARRALPGVAARRSRAA